MPENPTGLLEQSLTLETIAEGKYRGVASEDYEANNGMYGGWTAAMLLHSILIDPRAGGSPSALTVNYIQRINPGSHITVQSRLLRAGRSVSHWQAEILDESQSEVLATASAIFAERKSGGGFLEVDMPEAPAPSTEGQFAPPGSFGERLAMTPVYGFPPLDQPHCRSLAWSRERSGRKIDALQLAFLADNYPPRIWYSRKAYCPMATVTMSVYFLATEQELDAAGSGFVLIEADGSRGESAIAGSKARLWSEQGALLATTEQLSWYRD